MAWNRALKESYVESTDYASDLVRVTTRLGGVLHFAVEDRDVVTFAPACQGDPWDTRQGLVGRGSGGGGANDD